MDAKIQKVKLTDDGLYLEFEDVRPMKKSERLEASVKMDGKWRPHADFKQAMDYLRSHLAYITEQTDDFTTAKKKLDQFKVTGVSISNIGTEQEGVVIVGTRRLRGNYVLNLVSRLVKVSDEEYEYVGELFDCVEGVCQEAREYIKGKRTPPSQTSMFDDDDDAKEGKAKVRLIGAPKKQLPGSRKQIANS